MKVQFKTQSGSLYELEGDQNGGTWKRLENSPDSVDVRTAGGTYNSCSPISIGSPVTIIGPPLVQNAGFDRREITTSPVTEIILGDGIEVLNGL